MSAFGGVFSFIFRSERTRLGCAINCLVFEHLAGVHGGSDGIFGTNAWGMVKSCVQNSGAEAKVATFH